MDNDVHRFSRNVRKGQWRPVGTDRMTGRAFSPASVKLSGETGWIERTIRDRNYNASYKDSSSGHLSFRSLSDIDRSTEANHPRPSASCAARKNLQHIPANTPPVFSGLRPRIWPHLLRLVTNPNVGQAPDNRPSQCKDFLVVVATGPG